MRTVLLAFIMALATQVSAEDLSNDNYSTDNKLLSEVKTRMVLDNGLVIHIWQWNDKAKALGLDKYPPAGLIAQDVELMYPDAIVKDENGYLMVDLPVPPSPTAQRPPEIHHQAARIMLFFLS